MLKSTGNIMSRNCEGRKLCLMRIPGSSKPLFYDYFKVQLLLWYSYILVLKHIHICIYLSKYGICLPI